MENCVVVVATSCELSEVSAGVRGMFPIKFDGDLAHSKKDRGEELGK